MTLDAKRIIWQKNSLEELKRLLGADAKDAIEDSIVEGNVEFPWPITIDSIEASNESGGQPWVTVVISFDKIDDATSYEIRLSPVSDAADGGGTLTYANVSGGFFGADQTSGSFSIGSAPLADQIGVLCIKRDIVESFTPTGLWSHWELIDENYTGYPGFTTAKYEVWLGYGTPDGSTLNYIIPGNNSDYGLWIYSDVVGTPYKASNSGAYGGTDGIPSFPWNSYPLSDEGDIGDIIAGFFVTWSDGVQNIYPQTPDSLATIDGLSGTDTAIANGASGAGKDGIFGVAGVLSESFYSVYPPVDSTATAPVYGYSAYISVRIKSS